jgi:YD repeat-containing protein
MKIELITDLENVEFPIIIKDKNGNEIYTQYEDGYWRKKTYDDNGNLLTYKYSEGYCCEYTYDDNGNLLTYKDVWGFCQIKGEYVSEEEYEAFLKL